MDNPMPAFYKLAPIEKSVMLIVNEHAEGVTLSEIASEIRYVEQKDCEAWLAPILVRLEATGFVRSDGEIYFPTESKEQELWKIDSQS